MDDIDCCGDLCCCLACTGLCAGCCAAASDQKNRRHHHHAPAYHHHGRAAPHPYHAGGPAAPIYVQPVPVYQHQQYPYGHPGVNYPSHQQYIHQGVPVMYAQPYSHPVHQK